MQYKLKHRLSAGAYGGCYVLHDDSCRFGR